MYIGIDIGGTKCAVTLGEKGGEIGDFAALAVAEALAAERRTV